MAENVQSETIAGLNRSFIWLRSDNGGVGFYYESKDCHYQRDLTLKQLDTLDCISNAVNKNDVLQKAKISGEEFDQFVEELNDWVPGVIIYKQESIAPEICEREIRLETERLRDVSAAISSRRGANSNFHRFELLDPQNQFEEIETTISYAFRSAHEALGARNYGQAFCEWLLATGKLKHDTKILEVGCGLGFLAKTALDFLDEQNPDIYKKITYTMFDISPALQEKQKKTCAKHFDKIRYVEGDILKYDFDGELFDLIICNEVIADLDVGVLDMVNVADKSPTSPAEEAAIRYELHCTPLELGTRKVTIINLGAIQMLEKVSQILRKDGNAVIVEYGSIDQSPSAVTFMNHLEFTVRFDHLCQVSQRLHLNPDLSILGDTLGFNPLCKTIDMMCFRTLSNSLLPYIGERPIPTFAYSPDAMRDVLGNVMDRIGNIIFWELRQPQSFSPFQFKLLSLTKG